MAKIKKSKSELLKELAGLRRQVKKLKKTEGTLLQERIQLRTLIDNLPDLVYFKDEEGRYILNNRAHLESLGISRQEDAIGKSAFDFHPPKLAQEYHDDEMRIIRTSIPISEKEERALHKASGEERWHLTSKIPLRDLQGKVVGIVGISRDITDRKNAEEALRHEDQNHEKDHEG